jgi:hypothetical protein
VAAFEGPQGSSSADLVFLQEVDKGSAEALARKSGLENFRFAKDEGMRVGEYGVATMSRLQLGATQLYTLPETAQGYDVILRTEARVAEGSLTLVNAFYPAGYDKEGYQLLVARWSHLPLAASTNVLIADGHRGYRSGGAPEGGALPPRTAGTWSHSSNLPGRSDPSSLRRTR